MSTQPLSLLSSPGSGLGAGPAGASNPLGGVSQAQSSGASNAADEDKALVELFHILWELSVGIVDYPADTASAGGAMGPVRMEVERLKEVLRRIMAGGASPAGSGAQGDRAKFAGQSLTQLFESLPPEIRNLLLHAFPNLRKMLEDEASAAAFPPASPDAWLRAAP